MAKPNVRNEAPIAAENAAGSSASESTARPVVAEGLLSVVGGML